MVVFNQAEIWNDDRGMNKVPSLVIAPLGIPKATLKFCKLQNINKFFRKKNKGIYDVVAVIFIYTKGESANSMQSSIPNVK